MDFVASVTPLAKEWGRAILSSPLLLAVAIPTILFLVWVAVQPRGKDLPPGSTLFDQTLSLFFETRSGHSPYQWTRRMFAKHKLGIFKARLIGQPSVVLAGADTMRTLLMKDFSDLEPFMPYAFYPLLGEKSTTLIKDRLTHKGIRILWSRFLSPNTISDITPKMAAAFNEHLSEWAADSGGQTFKAFDATKRAVFDTMARVLLGVRYSKEEIEDFVSLINTYEQGFWINIPLDIPGFSFNKALKARKAIDVRTGALLDKFQKELDQRSRDPSFEFHYTLLHAFLEYSHPDGKPMTRKEHLDHAIGLIFGAYTTVASSFSSALQLLHLNPSAFQKIREEQDQIIARHGPIITGAAVSDMKYTEAAARETLRVRTGGNAVIRKAAKDLYVDGYRIPKGWQVFLNYELTHCADKRVNPDRDPDFPHMCFDGAAYDPSRWLDPERRPLDYTPFSQGPKMCPGQHYAMREIVLLLALLARGFDYEIQDGSLEWAPFLLPVFKSGVPIKIWKRGEKKA